MDFKAFDTKKIDEYSRRAREQWGKSPEEIDPSIIKRVPVRSNYDVNYFNDYNQGIPLTGYNSLFERLLDHPGIAVRTNAAFRLEGRRFLVGGDELPSAPLYYSGPIDALFGYRFGALPWRTLRFEVEKLAVRDFQGTSVVNYTESSVPYTRIHEFKHYHPEDAAVMNAEKTIVMREYSAAWKEGDEPYYPVDNADSRALHARYKAEAGKYRAKERFAFGFIDLETGEQTVLTVAGRHDPCIALRAVPVMEAVAAIVLLDLITAREK